MKKVLLTTCLLAFAAFSIAQQNGATITFKEYNFNYGTINEDDGIASHEFDFTNTGTSPLIIQRVATSCGCTTPDWSKEPIAPGKNGKIIVAYNPKSRPGPFSKTITVYSNSSQNAIVLQISGEVKPHVKTIDEAYQIPIGDIRFEKNHLPFGRMFINKTYTDTLKFLNVSENPVKVTPNIQNMDFMSVSIVPQTVKPKEIGNVIITYNPEKRNDWGFVVDRFFISINNQPFNYSPIAVSGSIEEDYASYTQKQLEDAPIVDFNTTTYNFGSKNEGDPVEYEFIIKNTGKSDLIIRKVKASCGCTTVEPKQKVLRPGDSSTIKAMFRTNGYSGQQNKSITVITNDPKNSTTILRLSGSVVKKN